MLGGFTCRREGCREEGEECGNLHCLSRHRGQELDGAIQRDEHVLHLHPGAGTGLGGVHPGQDLRLQMTAQYNNSAVPDSILYGEVSLEMPGGEDDMTGHCLEVMLLLVILLLLALVDCRSGDSGRSGKSGTNRRCLRLV